MFRILIAEALRPHDLTAVHQRDGECWELLLVHLVLDKTRKCGCDLYVVFSRAYIGLILRAYARGHEPCGQRAIGQSALEPIYVSHVESQSSSLLSLSAVHFWRGSSNITGKLSFRRRSFLRNPSKDNFRRKRLERSRDAVDISVHIRDKPQSAKVQRSG